MSDLYPYHSSEDSEIPCYPPMGRFCASLRSYQLHKREKIDPQRMASWQFPKILVSPYRWPYLWNSVGVLELLGDHEVGLPASL